MFAIAAQMFIDALFEKTKIFLKAKENVNTISFKTNVKYLYLEIMNLYS